jgi:hypothetical protein
MRNMSQMGDLCSVRRTKHCLKCDGLHTPLRLELITRRAMAFGQPQPTQDHRAAVAPWGMSEIFMCEPVAELTR